MENERSWDGHANIKDNHSGFALETDIPIAALLADLKQRGLLDDTIVLWTTEFGRMPCSQGSKGRDHNPFGFTNWLAGGGIKGGVTYGYRFTEMVREWNQKLSRSAQRASCMLNSLPSRNRRTPCGWRAGWS